MIVCVDQATDLRNACRRLVAFARLDVQRDQQIGAGTKLIERSLSVGLGAIPKVGWQVERHAHRLADQHVAD